MWCGVDEGDGVVVMISDWLELDAADDWVRHDSEIVSACIRSFLSLAVYISPSMKPQVLDLCLYPDVT